MGILRPLSTTPPEPPRSTSNLGLEVLRGGSRGVVERLPWGVRGGLVQRWGNKRPESFACLPLVLAPVVPHDLAFAFRRRPPREEGRVEPCAFHVTYRRIIPL